MKRIPKSDSDPHRAFRSLLGRVLEVSKDELDASLADEREAKANRPHRKAGRQPKQPVSSAHVSTDRD